MAKENHLSYKPTAEGVTKISAIRQKFIEIDDLIDSLTGNDRGVPLDYAIGRPVSLAKTHLETARMWAVNAVVQAHNDGPADEQGNVNGAAQAA